MYTNLPSGGGRRRGRPRSEELRLRILHAAIELASAGGVDIGFDRIAQAAGASRTTLYRWWSDPQELLTDALLESISDSVEATADDPIAALRTQVMETVAILVNPPTAGPLRALAARALADPAAHTMFVEHWLRPRRRFIRDLVGNAARRGLLMPSAGDVDEVVDILFGPLYYRAFFTGETLDEGFVERLLIAAGVTPAEPDGDLIDLGR